MAATDKDCTDILVQIEGLKKDVENVNHLNNRLDVAIEKLTDVSTSIKQMLAIHEEKIKRQERRSIFISSQLYHVIKNLL